jgi:hypothetical protein
MASVLTTSAGASPERKIKKEKKRNKRGEKKRAMLVVSSLWLRLIAFIC